MKSPSFERVFFADGTGLVQSFKTLIVKWYQTFISFGNRIANLSNRFIPF